VTYVEWQTVPEAASIHRKRTIADSGQPCTSDIAVGISLNGDCGGNNKQYK